MDRIHSIDIVRGTALLGLLPMNILGFALPFASYLNPSAFQGDWWFTYFSHFIVRVFIDQKMMGLFSFLFGCSIALIVSRNKAKGRRAGVLHYVRNFWLLIFGALHFICIWEGDILLVYAGIALLIYPLYFLSLKVLLSIAAVMWGFALYATLSFSNQLSLLVQNATESVAIWAPDANMIKQESARLLQSYSSLISERTQETKLFSDSVSKGVLNWFLVDALLRACALILAGMAIGKSQFWYTKTNLSTFKIAIFLVCFAWTLSALGFIYADTHQWQLAESFVPYTLSNNIAVLLCVAGYIVLIKWWTENSSSNWLKGALANCGKMALSNYLAQSILMTTIFYGYGLALYQSLNRLELWGVVFVTCALQLGWSVWIMRRYSHGPFEALWRKLSFSK